MTFQLPNDTQRATIIGKTGSGKTQAGVWLLSQRSYDRRPWVVLDYKMDDLIAEIPGKRTISIHDKPPKHAGIYVVHPTPDQEEAVEKFLWRMWEQERIGLYIDEGYMLSPNSPGYKAILTQGRSKRIPVITLTQRPVLVSRFAFSEADFIQMFQLVDDRDKKTVKQFMPLPIENNLPGRYHSWWWDNVHDVKAILRPVPDKDTIMATFRSRLAQPRRAF